MTPAPPWANHQFIIQSPASHLAYTWCIAPKFTTTLWQWDWASSAISAGCWPDLGPKRVITIWSLLGTNLPRLAGCLLARLLTSHGGHSCAATDQWPSLALGWQLPFPAEQLLLDNQKLLREEFKLQKSVQYDYLLSTGPHFLPLPLDVHLKFISPWP